MSVILGVGGITQEQARRIRFSDSTRCEDDDFRSECLECRKAGRTELFITTAYEGRSAHNNRKMLHRDRHYLGMYPNPSHQKDTA